MNYNDVARSDFTSLASAFNIATDNKTTDQIKNELKEKIKTGKELVYTTKTNMSTAFPFAGVQYSAGRTDGQHDQDDSKEIGIEYIILAKKGTAAANVMSEAMRKNEAELTIAQNTKLRIIKAELDGDAKIISGNKYSGIWRQDGAN
ncbi:MAG: hypothetical protein K6E91_09965 [Butyrivibrio sp.]|nr:hypothetical protein [Butyrivibrio sp.]